MRLDLNLASRPFVNHLPQVLLLSVLGAAALGLTAWNVVTVARSASEAQAVEGQLAELQEQEQELKARTGELEASLRDVDLAPLQTRATATNEVLAQKALKWSLLLERLEDLLPWKAALQSVQADVGKEGVVLSLRVRARSQDELLDFLDALEGSECFSEAYPGSETIAKGGEFETTVQVAHDPYCGHAPEVPGMKARGAVTRRGGSRG
jgi:type IV pilus assembly protein PilN